MFRRVFYAFFAHFIAPLPMNERLLFLFVCFKIKSLLPKANGVRCGGTEFRKFLRPLMQTRKQKGAMARQMSGRASS